MDTLFDNKNLFVALTYRCNAFCKKCMTRYHKNRDGEMSLDLIDRLVEQLQSHQYEGLISVGSGEPLLYPHLPYFLTKILDVNNKISLRILSNGMLFNSNLPAEYFGPRCKWGITLDAFRQDSLSDFQRGVQIEQVKENIAGIVKKWGPDRLYLNYTLHQKNHKELVDYCRFAAELGIKEVYATGLKIYEGYETRLCEYQWNDTPEIRSSIACAADILEKKGISSTGLQIIGSQWNSACFLRKKAAPVIDIDGTVSFCSGREDVIIGNICDYNIGEVWADMCEKLASHPENWCRTCHAKQLDNGSYTLPKVIDRESLLRQLELERDC